MRTTCPVTKLLRRVTKLLFRKWQVPTMDLFASQQAHVVQTYCSLDRTDNQAAFHDAMSLTWHFPLAWVFPPPYLIPRVLAHLNNSSGTFLVVVPRWENVFRRPDLKSRALALPFTVSNLAEVLVDTTTGLPPHNVHEITLEIWKCGGGINI